MKVKDLETAGNFYLFIFSIHLFHFLIVGSENYKHLINNHFIDDVTYC
jgi:hypothetical protein